MRSSTSRASSQLRERSGSQRRVTASRKWSDRGALERESRDLYERGDECFEPARSARISQNGALVSGTIRVTNNGQVIQFIPSSQWQPGALVQIFLTSAAQSVSGLNVNNYQASFTTGSDASTTAPTLVATSGHSGINVPTNVVIDFAFNEPLDPTALLPDTVDCSQNGVWFQTGVSVINGGTVLQVTPRCRWQQTP